MFLKLQRHIVNNLKLAVFVVLSACTDNNTIICDCEKIKDSKFVGLTSCTRFTNTNFNITSCRTNQKSRSGNYAVLLTNDCPYGMGYIIENAIPKECFEISAWRHVSNRKGVLVASAQNITDFYIFQHQSNTPPEGEWEKLSFDLIIPASVRGKAIKIYVWNGGDSLPILFDDLKIKYLGTEVTMPIRERSFFTDARDGQKYETVKIGEDWWMTSNLNFNISDSCYCYGNKEEYCEKYGKLYDYRSANLACPEGWKLPTDNDWKRLEKNTGMNEVEIKKYGWRGYDEGAKLKEYGNSGLELKLSGAYARGFYNLHRSGYFWTSTGIDSNYAFCREISQRLDIGRFKDLKMMRFSVRCIKSSQKK